MTHFRIKAAAYSPGQREAEIVRRRVRGEVPEIEALLSLPPSALDVQLPSTQYVLSH